MAKTNQNQYYQPKYGNHTFERKLCTCALGLFRRILSFSGDHNWRVYWVRLKQDGNETNVRRFFGWNIFIAQWCGVSSCHVFFHHCVLGNLRRTWQLQEARIFQRVLVEVVLQIVFVQFIGKVMTKEHSRFHVLVTQQGFKF